MKFEIEAYNDELSQWEVIATADKKENAMLLRKILRDACENSFRVNSVEDTRIYDIK